MYPISNYSNFNQSLTSLKLETALSFNLNTTNYINNSISTTNYLLNYSNYPNSSSLINDVRINESNNQDGLPVNTSIIEENIDDIIIEFNDRLPLFYRNKNLIKIPTKILRTLRRNTPKHLLSAIHENIDVAVELCLFFTIQLTSTYFDLKENPNASGWKSLKSEYLRELLLIDSMTYKRVIEALEHP
ncbi:MAG TPA: hypothetical protein VFM99_05550, partial [Chitinophagales bacterium]|nr:hypothetical protein [Chitinophagales bacterium]